MYRYVYYMAVFYFHITRLLQMRQLCFNETNQIFIKETKRSLLKETFTVFLGKWEACH